MDNFVNEGICAERHTNANDRFARDKERIDKVETHQAEQDERSQKIEILTVQTAEILKTHDEKIESYGQRIGVLENKPAKLWEKLQYAIIGALASGFVAALLASLLK